LAQHRQLSSLRPLVSAPLLRAVVSYRFQWLGEFGVELSTALFFLWSGLLFHPDPNSRDAFLFDTAPDPEKGQLAAPDKGSRQD
jgi:hypothetical protein